MNYTEVREVFDVKRMIAGTIREGGSFTYNLQGTLSSLILDSGENAGKPNPNCLIGDHYHDMENKMFYLCLTGNGRTALAEYTENIDLNGVYCRDTCPNEGKYQCTREVANVRYFYDLRPNYAE